MVLYRILTIFIFGIITTACVRELPEEPSMTPLPVGFIDKDNFLVDEVWLLAEVVHQGEVIDFSAISPVTVTFHETGYLNVLSTNCNAFGYKIIVESDEHHYRLFSGTSTAVSCDGLKQEQAVGNALKLTNRYEISKDKLVLIGEDVQVVLEPDLANYFRGDRVEFIRHNWQLITGNYSGVERSFDAIEPTIIRFESNSLIVEASDCVSFGYMIAPRIAQSYQLVNRYVISTYPDNEFPDCGEPANQQIVILAEALETTTRYKFEGDQLHLLGDDVEIILAPEPIPGSLPASTSPVAMPPTP